jgi:hypothetical protein
MINVINEILRQQLKKLVENQKIQTYRERERGEKNQLSDNSLTIYQP